MLANNQKQDDYITQRYSSPIKNPFPAASVLRCIQTDVLIVATSACRIANGKTLSEEDLQRLVLAAHG